MEDKKVGKLAETLLAGGKMLSRHCPDCRTPLFEYGGKITCPSCGGEVIEEGKLAERTEGKARGEIREEGLSSQPTQIVQDKLKQLGERLKDETEPREISKILKAMKSALEVLEKLEAW